MGSSFQPHQSIFPEIEQFHSNDKKFIVMNESIPSPAALSAATFMGPPVSILYPSVLQLSKRGECQQPQGGVKAPGS